MIFTPSLAAGLTHEGLSPFKTTINGCTWGGRAIKVDVVAACGLHLEFANQLMTTRIQKVDVIRYEGVQRVRRVPNIRNYTLTE